MRIAEIEIRYTDGNGQRQQRRPRLQLREMPVRGIVNDRIQKVRFQVKSNGTLEWDSRATPDIITIGNAMARTPTGLVQLRKLDEAKYPIKMKISPAMTSKYGYFEPERASTRNESFVRMATLYIYENEIRKYILGVQGGGVSITRNRLIDLEDAYAYFGWYEILLGMTGSHEAEHSDIGNIQLSIDTPNQRYPTKFDPPWEQVPYDISLKVAEEEYNNLSSDDREKVDNFIQSIN
ncbi:MAG TPA: hypothetical protein DIT04_01630 [Dysgonomonas sp.]|nr:hypothetical protein [Dysgonomonas sp.]